MLSPIVFTLRLWSEHWNKQMWELFRSKIPQPNIVILPDRVRRDRLIFSLSFFLKHVFTRSCETSPPDLTWPESCVLHQTLDLVSRLPLHIACQLQSAHLCYDLSKPPWLANCGADVTHIQPVFLHPAVSTPPPPNGKGKRFGPKRFATSPDHSWLLVT